MTSTVKAMLLVALLVLFSAYTVGVYRAGGAAPKAELKALQSQVRAAHDAQVKEDNRREAQHQQLLKDKDHERETKIAAVNRDWKSYIAGLPKPASGASKDTKPVPIVAEGLNDAADRERVSAAVSRFRDEVREAFREFRDEVAGQLEHAQLQTDALIRAQAWAGEEQKINAP